jgi:hypothetical protein
MQEVSFDRSGKGRDKAEVFFQIVKDGFNLGSKRQGSVLPPGKEFFSLRVMGRCHNDRAIGLKEMSTHDASAIRGIPNRDLCTMVENVGHGLRIMKIRRGQQQTTKLATMIDGSMELESIVPSLMVLAKLGNVFGDLVLMGSHKTTDFHHRGVHEF